MPSLQFRIGDCVRHRDAPALVFEVVEILEAVPPGGRYPYLYKCRAVHGDRRKRYTYDHTVLTLVPPNLPGLELPPIPPELDLPIRALVRSAGLLEAVVVALAEGRSFREVAAAIGLENLEVAAKAVEVWREHLGIADDEDEARPGRRRRRS